MAYYRRWNFFNKSLKTKIGQTSFTVRKLIIGKNLRFYQKYGLFASQKKTHWNSAMILYMYIYSQPAQWTHTEGLRLCFRHSTSHWRPFSHESRCETRCDASVQMRLQLICCLRCAEIHRWGQWWQRRQQQQLKLLFDGINRQMKFQDLGRNRWGRGFRIAPLYKRNKSASGCIDQRGGNAKVLGGAEAGRISGAAREMDSVVNLNKCGGEWHRLIAGINHIFPAAAGYGLVDRSLSLVIHSQRADKNTKGINRGEPNLPLSPWQQIRPWFPGHPASKVTQVPIFHLPEKSNAKQETRGGVFISYLSCPRYSFVSFATFWQTYRAKRALVMNPEPLHIQQALLMRTTISVRGKQRRNLYSSLEANSELQGPMWLPILLFISHLGLQRSSPTQITPFPLDVYGLGETFPKFKWGQNQSDLTSGRNVGVIPWQPQMTSHRADIDFYPVLFFI